MPEMPSQMPDDPIDEAQDLKGTLTSPAASIASLRTVATDPDLRIARVDVVQVLAVDLGQLTEDRESSLRALQKLRARDQLSKILRGALIGRVSGCASESKSIRERMIEAKSLHGKAVWSNGFVDRFAPILLPVSDHLVHNDAERHSGARLSDDPNSALHYVRFGLSRLKLFGDGTLTFTVRLNFLDRSSHREGGTAYPPASIDDAIDRLLMIEQIAVGNFGRAVADFFRPDSTREIVEDAITKEAGDRFVLKNFDVLDNEEFSNVCERHRVILVENFYHDDAVRQILKAGPGQGLDSLREARANLQRVLTSSSLAGLLNTATWYKKYNERYIQSLLGKEIGYKTDEIYLTDRKATVICCEGFWDEGGNGRPPDPLTRYKRDIVLAVEYCTARLAYLTCVLGYYQDHPDVRNIENARPLDVLPRVIDGRAVLSHITESLDLKLLVNHGFTRLFIQRLREELGLDSIVSSIRQRVMDTSQSVDLKSSVLAAEHTSKENLRAAVENNTLQRLVLTVAAVTVTITVLLFLIDRLWL